jgi:hypothetical protein
LSPVFFTDRDLGLKFPQALADAHLSVERHAAHFADNAPDEEWLGVVGARGWVAITHDKKIRYKPNERDAVMRNGVALLVVVGGAPLPELARSFVATMPRMARFLAKNQPPFIAKVYRALPAELARNPAAPGRIEMWYPTA